MLIMSIQCNSPHKVRAFIFKYQLLKLSKINYLGCIAKKASVPFGEQAAECNYTRTARIHCVEQCL